MKQGFRKSAEELGRIRDETLARLRNERAKYDYKQELKGRYKTQEDRNTIEPGSEEERILVEDLERRVQNLQMDMGLFDFHGQKWLELNASQEAKELNEFNRVMQRRMVLMAASPLLQGVNSRTIARSLGMSIGLAMTNPNFKKGLKDAMGVEPKMQKALETLGGTKLYEKDFPGMVRFVDEGLAKLNNGRLPFTKDTAAAMRFALLNQAYTQMREPGADLDKIRTKYNDSMRTLDALAQSDGISLDELDQQTKILYEHAKVRYPGLKYRYHETAYNEVERAEDWYEPYVDKNQEGEFYESIRNYWEGDFVKTSMRGKEAGEIFEGFFTLREPMRLEDLQDRIQLDLRRTFDIPGVDPKDVANGYMAAFAKSKISSYGHPIEGEAENFQKLEASLTPEAKRWSDYYATLYDMAQEDGLKYEAVVKASVDSFSKTVYDYGKDKPDFQARILEWIQVTQSKAQGQTHYREARGAAPEYEDDSAGYEL